MADTVKRYYIDEDGNPLLTTSEGATAGASEAYVNNAVSEEAVLRAAADSDLQDQIDDIAPLTAGAGITITGTGTIADPYVISLT